MKGINLQLHNGSTPLASLTDIQARYWDDEELKDTTTPLGKTSVATTDASGYINLDISRVTGKEIGEVGFLVLYKKDATDHQDSPVFEGKVEISDIAAGVDMYYFNTGYVRPADWLPIEEVQEGTQKFVGLWAVFDNGSNHCRLKCRAAYTVDWGDGSAPENFADNVAAEHTYTYADLDASTYCSRGYRQAIITVTPQASNDLNEINLNERFTGYSAGTYSPKWLDISCGTNPASTNGLYFGSTVNARMLEKVRLVGTGARTSFNSFLRFCTRLQDVNEVNFSSATNLVTAFGGTPIKALPDSYYSAVSLLADKTNNLSAIAIDYMSTVDCAGATNISNILSTAIRVSAVRLTNTSTVTNISTAFNGMVAAVELPAPDLPALDFSAVTNATTAFNGMNSLSRIRVTGLAVTHSLASCNLSATAINEHLTNLPTVTGSQSVTFTGNPGAATCTPSIGTTKGWNVIV